MEVSEELIQSYLADDTKKEIKLYFPRLNLMLRGSSIDDDSLYLRESICDSQSFEFVGCIASKFCIIVRNAELFDLEGEQVEVSCISDDVYEVPLFTGSIKSAMQDTVCSYKEIVAFDALSTKGSIDITDWYNSLRFPLTMRAIRDSLFSYIGIEQEPTDLPNDDILIGKEYAPNTMKALPVIKSICQINGACGIMNRNGRFEYRILQELIEDDGAYPPLYPPFYPGAGSGSEKEPQYVAYYKDCQYQEYKVNPVDRIIIRQSENDPGVSYGEGENTYIIQGSMFTVGLSEQTLLKMARRVYENVQGIEFHPFKADQNGMPWIECGKDAVSYYALEPDGTYSEKSFYVFSRELKGIQALRDVFKADGDKYQRKFITDLRLQLDTIKNETNQYNNRIEQVERGLQQVPNFFLVDAEPPASQRVPNSFYFIKGEVVVN